MHNGLTTIGRITCAAGVKMLDINKDGIIDRPEMEHLTAKLMGADPDRNPPPPPGEPGVNDPGLSGLMGLMDQNGNGAISGRDFASFIKAYEQNMETLPQNNAVYDSHGVRKPVTGGIVDEVA